MVEKRTLEGGREREGDGGESGRNGNVVGREGAKVGVREERNVEGREGENMEEGRKRSSEREKGTWEGTWEK